jgi:DNA (cytosine-5)-methyltransferase 1
MRHLDLFSGIGGFALAADRVWSDVEHIFCEIDPFCRKVLQKHWHNAHIHGDIKKVEGGGIGSIDLLTGGFPCQPFSAAGKRAGTEDDRHLWPEMFRVIREVRPRWIIGENVGGILTWSRGLVVEQVFADLESAGYETQPFIIPAAGVGAPHRRDRVWFVAHRPGSRVGRLPVQSSRRRRTDKNTVTHRKGEDVPNTDRRNVQRCNAQAAEVRSESEQRPTGLRNRGGRGNNTEWPAEPAVGRVAHGVPDRVDRIKALGNAIVPQVAEEIMRGIAAVGI